VTANNAAGIDDALIRSANQTASKREILRGGQTPRQRRRRFQVGHQNRCRAPIGMLDKLHSFEMRQVSGVSRRRQMRHPCRGLDLDTKARKLSMSVIDPKHQRATTRYVHARDPRRRGQARPHGGHFSGLHAIDEVREHGIDDQTKLLSAARRTRQHIAA
jgi:hypothetical protein